MNIVDRAVSFFNPKAGIKRAMARQALDVVNKGYSHHGASHSKNSMSMWDYSSGSADEDIHDNLDVLRERSRDLFYSAPIAASAIKTSRTNTVGSGLKCKPKIDREILALSDEFADKWERNTKAEFNLWAESIHCDAQRMNNFYELQQLAFMCWGLNGDTFALLPMIKRKQIPYDLRVMLVEPDRIRTPDIVSSNKKIRAGVEVSEYGEVVAYHLLNHFPKEMSISATSKYKRISKFGKESGRQNIIHLMTSERVGQVRGIPKIAGVIESLKQISRYTEAEITAAVISAYFTIFIENKSSENLGAFGASDDPYKQTERPDESEDDDYDEPSNLKLAPGAIMELAEGQSVKEANPTRPNANFDGFIRAMAVQIGASLEIPADILLKDFNKSYSASRASLLEAWKTFRMEREWFANDFCQPIYEEWLTEAIAKGRIDAPGFLENPLIRKAYCGAEWNGPAPGQIDPLKEVNAAIKKVDNGFSTREQETMGLTGGNFRDNISTLKKENELMKDAGLKEEANATAIQK